MSALFAWSRSGLRVRIYIEYDADLQGWYVWVFLGDRDSCVADYLQDTLEQAKSFAKDEFGVEESDWCEVEAVPWPPESE